MTSSSDGSPKPGKASGNHESALLNSVILLKMELREMMFLTEKRVCESRELMSNLESRIRSLEEEVGAFKSEFATRDLLHEESERRDRSLKALLDGLSAVSEMVLELEGLHRELESLKPGKNLTALGRVE